MLSRLKAWWTMPSALELELKATRQAGAEFVLKIRDLKEEIRVLKNQNVSLKLRLYGATECTMWLESETADSSFLDGFDDEACCLCGNDIDDCDCFDDEFDCKFCGLDIDDCTCDDEEDRRW